MAEVTFKVFIDGSSAGLVRAGTDAERSLKRVSSSAASAGSAGSRGLGIMGSAAIDLSKEIGRIRAQLSSFAVVAGAGVGLAVFARDIVRSSNALIGFKQGLAAATGSQREAADSLSFVRTTALQLGTDLQGSIHSFTGLAAAAKGSRLEGEGVRDIFTAVSEASRVLNLSVDDQRRALLALEQMISKGTVASEELRGQLGERLPGAFNLAAKAMGVSTSELSKMLKNSEVLAEDLIPKLAVALRKTLGDQAAIAAKTPAADLQRLANAVFELEAAIGEAGFMQALAIGARSLTDTLSDLVRSGSIDKVLSGIVAIGAAGATVFAGRLLSGLIQFTAAQARAATASALTVSLNRSVAESALQVATAQNVERVAALAAIEVSRSEQVAKLRLAAADVAQAEAAISAAAANNAGSFALKVQKEATDRLAASQLRLGAVTREMAVLGQQQASVQGLLAASSTAQIAAQTALNGALSRGSIAMGVLRSAGSKLLGVIGGWPTVIIAAGFALSKLWDIATAGDQALRGRITQLRELSEELERQARLSALVETGQATTETAGQVSLIKAQVDDAIRLQSELASLKQRYAELQQAGGRAVGAIAPEIGVVSSELRAVQENVLRAASALKSMGQLTPEIRAMVIQVGDLSDHFAASTGPISRFGRAVKEAFTPKSNEDFTKSLKERINSLKSQLIELKDGAGPALRAVLEFDALSKTGARSVNELDQATRKLIDDAVGLAAALEAQKAAQKESTREQKQAKKTIEELRKEGEAFRDETKALAAELSGPTAQALLEYENAIQDAAELLKVGAISIDEFNLRSRLQEEQLKRTNAEIARQRAPIQQMLDDLEFEAELIGLSNTQREIAIALRQIEADAQENVRTLTEAEIEAKKQQIRLQIEANAAQQATVDAAQQAADDYQQAWQGATEATLRSFVDFTLKTKGSFNDLGDQLRNIARGFLSDIATQFLKTKLEANFSAFFGGSPGSSGNFPAIGQVGASGGASAAPGGASAAGNFNIWAALAVQAEQDARGLLSGGGGTGAKLRNVLIGAIIGAGAANKLNSLTGGGLFGTKFATDTSGTDITIGEGGATGIAFDNQKKKKALFGGTKRRTVQSALDADAQQAINDLFDTIGQSIAIAASAFGIEVPALISGRFKQTFDKNGNLKEQFSEIAGRVFNEGRDAFAKRLQAENAINVIDLALNVGAIGEVQNEASTIAERWRSDASDLLDGAQFLLSAAADLREGFGLLGTDGTLTQITDLVEDLNKAGEPLVDTYLRLSGATRLLEQALELSSISLDLGREQFVRFSAGIVEAAGGLDKAASLWNGYFNRFFSDNERAATALTAAQQAAQARFGDIGLDATGFANADGLAQFRELFEQALPTLSAEAVVQWLEAAQAIGAVIDAQAALDQTLSESEQQVDQFAEALADFMSGIRDQARTAADALSDFGLSPLSAGLQQVARDMERAIAEATRLGATESDLAEIRELGAAQSELLRRQAQAELSDLLAEVNVSLAELDASPLEVELSRIQSAMHDALDQASALGATEDQLTRIRELGARQTTVAVEAEVQRLRDVFAELARSIGAARGAIGADILNIRRTQPGFSEAGFQAAQIAGLRDQLAAASDPNQQIDLIDQIRQATVARYGAEIADIQQTAQAQDQAAQQAQQSIEAQRQALLRLRDFAEGLGLSSNSPLTAFQRLDVARSQFDTLLGRARGGDTDAIGGLQQAAEALLAENRAVFGVSRAAVAEFDRVQAALRSVAGQGVRGAVFSDPFQNASIDVSSRIAELQADAIAELQGLDDTLAALQITQEADTEGTIQALRDRFDQAEVHTGAIIDHLQPIFDAVSRQNSNGEAQVAQLQRQSSQLERIALEIQAGADINAAWLDKFIVYAKQQETTMSAMVERLGRSIERSNEAKVRA